MKYKCLICNKEFNQKGHYEAHNKRKFKCSLKYSSINDETNISNITPPIPTNSHQNTTEFHQNTTNFHQNISNIPKNINNETLINPNDLTCNYCNKLFSRKDALLRHINGRCKIQKNNMSYNQLLEENLKLKEENTELKTNFTEIYKEIDEIKQSAQQNNQQLCKVSKSKNTNSHNATTTNTNTNTNTNSQNTITTNSHNSVTNNVNNNITLNATLNFGDEKLSNIPEKQLLNALTKTITNAFLNFIQVVNLNENNPEHQNILINNMQNDIGTMIEDNKPVIKTKQEIIENIFNTRLPEMEELVEQYNDEDKLTKREYKILKELIKFLKTAYIETEDVEGNIVKADKDTIKKLKTIHKNIIHMFYNNRSMVGKNMKKLIVEPIINPLMKIMNINTNDTIDTANTINTGNIKNKILLSDSH